MTNATHTTTDPRPFRTDGPYDKWIAATSRPTFIGQRVVTFGAPGQPSVLGHVVSIEGDGDALVKTLTGSDLYVDMRFAAAS